MTLDTWVESNLAEADAEWLEYMMEQQAYNEDAEAAYLRMLETGDLTYTEEF